MRVNYFKFLQDCQKLKNDILIHNNNCPNNKIETLYAVPRGGVNVALLLGFPLVEKNKISDSTLIVDDLVDSGKTLEGFSKGKTAVLYRKSHSPFPMFWVEELPSEWIEFFYEESKSDRENLVRRTLELIGEDPNREGLKDTPNRVDRLQDELFIGYSQSSEELFQRAVFSPPKTPNEMILIKDIPFYSTCEHHMVPFFGMAHIGYIPKTKLLGLSKFARLLDIYARRLQIQETLTDQVCSDLDKYLQPMGVIVVLQAEHLCMTMRGVQKPGAKTITSSLRGCFNDQEVRSEFFSLLKT